MMPTKTDAPAAEATCPLSLSEVIDRQQHELRIIVDMLNALVAANPKLADQFDQQRRWLQKNLGGKAVAAGLAKPDFSRPAFLQGGSVE